MFSHNRRGFDKRGSGSFKSLVGVVQGQLVMEDLHNFSHEGKESFVNDNLAS